MVPKPLCQQVKMVAQHVCAGLSTPVSLKVSMLIEAEEWDTLASCRVSPHNYIDAESYWRDATAVSILRKLQELPTSTDRKAAAEEAFLASEASCARTNDLLSPYLFGRLYADADEDVLSYIRKVRKVIRQILGPCPQFIEGKFGPGATYGDRGRLTTIPDKVSSIPTLTPDACHVTIPWHQTLWARACSAKGREKRFIPGNRFTTVPKDNVKDRGIAIEPSINVFYQLGVGKILKRRLKRAGIDLQFGQDIHRRVACEASIKGHLATIDLSNASDTISKVLVKLLLPSDWFSLLDDLRSKKTEFRGKWHVLEKFSSMGNGFTFELETLIFLGLCLGLSTDSHKLEAGKNVFVFGDDIIVPTETSKAVIPMLKFFGLTVNKSKSFVDGPFRESCGGDYFMGMDVRPYFLENTPSEPQDFIAFANGIREACKGNPVREAALRRAWFCILDALPVRVRSLRGPKALGDLVVHDEESRWRFRYRSNGIRYIQVYRPATYRKVKWSNFGEDAVLASVIYGVRYGRGEGVIPRDGVSGYKIGWVAFS